MGRPEQVTSEDGEAWASLLNLLEHLGRTRTVKVLRYPHTRRSDGQKVATVRVAGFTEKWAWHRSRWMRIIEVSRNR